MRGLIAAAAGGVAGYCLARALEARAHGLPVSVALSGWRHPVVNLKLEWLARQGLADGPMRPAVYQELSGVDSMIDVEAEEG